MLNEIFEYVGQFNQKLFQETSYSSCFHSLYGIFKLHCNAEYKVLLTASSNYSLGRIYRLTNVGSS